MKSSTRRTRRLRTSCKPSTPKFKSWWPDRSESRWQSRLSNENASRSSRGTATRASTSQTDRRERQLDCERWKACLRKTSSLTNLATDHLSTGSKVSRAFYRVCCHAHVSPVQALDNQRSETFHLLRLDDRGIKRIRGAPHVHANGQDQRHGGFRHRVRELGRVRSVAARISHAHPHKCHVHAVGPSFL